MPSKFGGEQSSMRLSLKKGSSLQKLFCLPLTRANAGGGQRAAFSHVPEVTKNQITRLRNWSLRQYVMRELRIIMVSLLADRWPACHDYLQMSYWKAPRERTERGRNLHETGANFCYYATYRTSAKSKSRQDKRSFPKNALHQFALILKWSECKDACA